jgi:uncharacterized membrane protein YeaQ/YmgE (transglycosylase-associated protein family)
MTWFCLIVVGAIAGWLGGRLMRGNGFGVIGDVMAGVAGAFIGSFVFASTGAALGGGLPGTLAAGTVGALLVLFVIRLFSGRRRGRRVWS